MNQNKRSGLSKSSSRFILILFGIVLTTALGLFLNASFGSALQVSNTQQRPTSLPDSTANWKNFSESRSNVDFSLKYHPSWNDPFDHCNTPPTSNGFGLSPKCIKIVIFTEDLPDENADLGRDIVLSSTTERVVSGYRAIRKVYTFPEDPSNTPDTYQLWIYDNGQPIMLLVAWIGEGTDLKTASDFVQHLDRVVNTLQLRRR